LQVAALQQALHFMTVFARWSPTRCSNQDELDTLKENHKKLEEIDILMRSVPLTLCLLIKE
jgi:hypothetical protein